VRGTYDKKRTQANVSVPKEERLEGRIGEKEEFFPGTKETCSETEKTDGFDSPYKRHHLVGSLKGQLLLSKRKTLLTRKIENLEMSSGDQERGGKFLHQKENIHRSAPKKEKSSTISA